ncbi:MFS transporter [Legionella hackeliae]|uniref:Putative Major facilitator superfamily MFS_1 n=1 Tax=Legionella hackeliae TaxID=449 RepID=A0A0A8USY6_LEGHA|nr:MFS transporter [Legionella hackeliae]KTD08748.1 Major Facilitator Superfamily protein [Legionella hackeliae]CEK10177.1 putative Major facilitator superfamily MFS_1 [Legionella hackeliae]STX46901.1 Major Facilitator Superfamily [Legionella hackeliae]
MNETLFYIIWGVRTLYVLSLKTILFTVIFLFFQYGSAVSELSLLGILINLPMVFSAFVVTRIMDRMEIKFLLVTILCVQTLALGTLILLMNHYQANLNGILVIVAVLFTMSSTEISLFDKSIVLLLPESKRARGVSLGLVTTAFGYISSPLLASVLLNVVDSKLVTFFAFISAIIYLLPLAKLNKKYISSEVNLDKAIFRLTELKLYPLSLQLLLAFSLTTVWTNFISFLVIPILNLHHPQWFVGTILSLSGIGALLGGMSISWLFQSKSNRKSLGICFAFTVSSMVLFILYSGSVSLSILLALMGGITSSWSYGISQIISQNYLDHNKIAGFYMFRNAASAILLMIFYAINAYFAKSIEAMIYAIVCFLFFFIFLYILFYWYGKSVVVDSQREND